MYTVGTLRGLGASSNMKIQLENWYTSNLASYESYIDVNAGFCGDRTPSTSSSSLNGSGGTGTTTTYYAGWLRLYGNWSASNTAPSLKCNSSDLYTISSSNKGNKAITKPIGLITADEVSYAGGVVGASTTGCYLYSNQSYWTMTPLYYDTNGSFVFIVYLGNWWTYGSQSTSYSGVRPVINLKKYVKFAGSGTSTDPYVVS